MSGDAATWRRPFRQNQQSGNGPRPPAEAIGGDSGGQSRLRVVPPERLFDGDELRLHLDDEHRRGIRAPPEQVNRAALKPDGVGDLDLDRPSGGAEQVRGRADQSSVRLVEQAVEVPASPAGQQEQIGIEGTKDRGDLADRNRVDLSPLDQGDE